MAVFDKIDTIARSQIGYHEGKTNGHWNNDQKYSDELPGFDWSDGQAWCATFVCWVFWKAGVYDLIETPSAGCDQLAVGFKREGRWSEYPAKGAVVFYGTASDLSHTGIVVDYDADYIYAVEGNTNDSGSREGDGVYLKKRARRDSYVVGYGYPEYPEGIETPDPKFQRKPEPVKPEPKPEPKPLPEVSLKSIQRAAQIAGWSRRITRQSVREDAAMVRQALNDEGVGNYKEWQRKQGIEPANGIPDMKSLKALGKRHKFKVVE